MTDIFREISAGERFRFGRNWKRFLRTVTEERIRRASSSLLAALRCDSLTGKSFLDIGSGSGLSCLAAFRAGARVTAFDYDPESVECTQWLRRKAEASEQQWAIMQGSVLDPEFMGRLERYDIVYSWGVLHHTGHMWKAIEATCSRVQVHGVLFIALYNDQGWISRYWTAVKRIYNWNSACAVLVFALHAPYFVAARAVGEIVRTVRRAPRDNRGMLFWYDVNDWLGGYPFEVAPRDEVVRMLEQMGFEPIYVKSVGRRSGCNQYLFRRIE